MKWSIEEFRKWGAQGGRMAARRLTKAQRRDRARKAGSAPKKKRKNGE